MTLAVTIRTLVQSDAEACAAIRREMLADAPWAFSSSVEIDRGVDPAKVRERLADPRHATIGVFDERGRLLGVAGIHCDTAPKMAHRAKVWGVYVKPEARGQRLGARIVSGAIEVARGWPGVNSVALSSSERSKAAQKTYAALGFTAWGREPRALVVDGVTADEIHMVLFL